MHGYKENKIRDVVTKTNDTLFMWQTLSKANITGIGKMVTYSRVFISSENSSWLLLISDVNKATTL